MLRWNQNVYDLRNYHWFTELESFPVPNFSAAQQHLEIIVLTNGIVKTGHLSPLPEGWGISVEE